MNILNLNTNLLNKKGDFRNKRRPVSLRSVVQKILTVVGGRVAVSIKSFFKKILLFAKYFLIRSQLTNVLRVAIEKREMECYTVGISHGSLFSTRWKRKNCVEPSPPRQNPFSKYKKTRNVPTVWSHFNEWTKIRKKKI